jgi:hypothetical protein
VQVKAQVFRYSYAATDKYTVVVWIRFDGFPIENGFDDMFAFKTLFQGMVHCVALDEIVSGSYSFADDFDVHPSSFLERDLALPKTIQQSQGKVKSWSRLDPL